MKSVKNMMNTDKAVTLHRLFPDAVPLILVFTIKHADYLEANKEDIRKQWEAKQQFWDFDYWLKTAALTKGTIDRYYKKMLKSPRLFADQLFDMGCVFFMIDCIIRYAGTLNEDSKLKKMIEILFS